MLELREQLAEQVAAQFDFVLLEVEVFAQAATEAVTTACAEYQTVVGSALAIGDLAAALAEGLALAPGRSAPRSIPAAVRWLSANSVPVTGACPAAAGWRRSLRRPAPSTGSESAPAGCAPRRVASRWPGCFRRLARPALRPRVPGHAPAWPAGWSRCAGYRWHQMRLLTRSWFSSCSGRSQR